MIFFTPLVDDDSDLRGFYSCANCNNIINLGESYFYNDTVMLCYRDKCVLDYLQVKESTTLEDCECSNCGGWIDEGEKYYKGHPEEYCSLECLTGGKLTKERSGER